MKICGDRALGDAAERSRRVGQTVDGIPTDLAAQQSVRRSVQVFLTILLDELPREAESGTLACGRPGGLA